MAIDYDTFLTWCEGHFDPVVAQGKEIKINSIFTEDSKFHLWCSVEGGKYEREDGCYHCWKTGRKGTLVGLVMAVENLSYLDAKEILNGGTPIHELEKRLDEFFAQKEVQNALPKGGNSRLRLPEETYLIAEMAASNRHRQEAEGYLAKRKLPSDNLLYCLAGNYRNRIVIPYYDRDDNLIYFNARHVGKSKLRYYGPPKTCGVGKGDVLYVPRWPPLGTKIYLTEGEFDALTLTQGGFPGVACGGKILTDRQAKMLQGYQICLCLDTDAAGLSGLVEMGRKLTRQFGKITYVRPPKVYKDWNNMLVDLHLGIIQHYVKKWELPFDNYVTEYSLLAGPCL